MGVTWEERTAVIQALLLSVLVAGDEAEFGVETQFGWKSLYMEAAEDLQLFPTGLPPSDQQLMELGPLPAKKGHVLT